MRDGSRTGETGGEDWNDRRAAFVASPVSYPVDLGNGHQLRFNYLTLRHPCGLEKPIWLRTDRHALSYRQKK